MQQQWILDVERVVTETEIRVWCTIASAVITLGPKKHAPCSTLPQRQYVANPEEVYGVPRKLETREKGKAHGPTLLQLWGARFWGGAVELHVNEHTIIAISLPQ